MRCGWVGGLERQMDRRTDRQADRRWCRGVRERRRRGRGAWQNRLEEVKIYLLILIDLPDRN